jgi:hypothetical protein
MPLARIRRHFERAYLVKPQYVRKSRIQVVAEKSRRLVDYCLMRHNGNGMPCGSLRTSTKSCCRKILTKRIQTPEWEILASGAMYKPRRVAALQGFTFLISKKTVFVIGTGAHVPYGFSTGEGLLVRARNLNVDQMHKAVQEQIGKTELAALAQTLKDNFLSSIDALLEHRQPLRQAGKKLILSMLLDEEERALNNRWAADEDWMSLIFQYMAEGAASPDQFATNPVTFITFNYDRFLEYRLVRGMVARYDVSAREAWEVISKFGFFHIYGSLGPLPEQTAPTDMRGIPFGALDTEEVTYRGLALQQAEHAIQIVHDAGSNVGEALERLHTGSNQQIFLFGFAFGKVNVDRLQTKQIPASIPVFCTTYNMTSAEVADCVTPAFPNHGFWSPNGSLISGNMPNAAIVTKADMTIKNFLRERISVFR